MLLTDLPNPHLPMPSHTHYPYPLTSRLKTHSSILNPLSNYAYGHGDANLPGGGPGPTTTSNVEKRDRNRLALKRAEARALAGRRPAGVELGKEAEELSDEERNMEDERVSSCLYFGSCVVYIMLSDASLGTHISMW